METCSVCIATTDKLFAGLPGKPAVTCGLCNARVDAHFTVQSAVLTAIPIILAGYLVLELMSLVLKPVVLAIGTTATAFATIHLTKLVP